MASDAWNEDIPIWIDGAQKWMTGLTRRTTCDDVIYALLYSRGLLDTDSTDNYAVFERWRAVERPLQGRTKIVKVWAAWGREQPNVQLLVQRLDDYFIPPEASKTRRRHRRSSRQRAKHAATHCRCQNDKTQCSKCGQVQEVEQLAKHLLRQERQMQELRRRVQETDRLISQYEACQHARRVQQNGEDYVQHSYLFHRHRVGRRKDRGGRGGKGDARNGSCVEGKRDGSSGGSSDLSFSSSTTTSSVDSIDALLLAVGEEQLEEYLDLCEGLHDVLVRLDHAQSTQQTLAREIHVEAHEQERVREEKAEEADLVESLHVKVTREVAASVLQQQQEYDVVQELRLWEAKVKDRSRKLRQLQQQLDNEETMHHQTIDSQCYEFTLQRESVTLHHHHHHHHETCTQNHQNQFLSSHEERTQQTAAGYQPTDMCNHSPSYAYSNHEHPTVSYSGENRDNVSEFGSQQLLCQQNGENTIADTNVSVPQKYSQHITLETMNANNSTSTQSLEENDISLPHLSQGINEWTQEEYDLDQNGTAYWEPKDRLSTEWSQNYETNWDEDMDAPLTLGQIVMEYQKVSPTLVKMVPKSESQHSPTISPNTAAGVINRSSNGFSSPIGVNKSSSDLARPNGVNSSSNGFSSPDGVNKSSSDLSRLNGVNISSNDCSRLNGMYSTKSAIARPEIHFCNALVNTQQEFSFSNGYTIVDNKTDTTREEHFPSISMNGDNTSSSKSTISTNVSNFDTDRTSGPTQPIEFHRNSRSTDTVRIPNTDTDRTSDPTQPIEFHQNSRSVRNSNRPDAQGSRPRNRSGSRDRDRSGSRPRSRSRDKSESCKPPVPPRQSLLPKARGDLNASEKTLKEINQNPHEEKRLNSHQRNHVTVGEWNSSSEESYSGQSTHQTKARHRPNKDLRENSSSIQQNLQIGSGTPPLGSDSRGTRSTSQSLHQENSEIAPQPPPKPSKLPSNGFDQNMNGFDRELRNNDVMVVPDKGYSKNGKPASMQQIRHVTMPASGWQNNDFAEVHEPESPPPPPPPRQAAGAARNNKPPFHSGTVHSNTEANEVNVTNKPVSTNGSISNECNSYPKVHDPLTHPPSFTPQQNFPSTVSTAVHQRHTQLIASSKDDSGVCSSDSSTDSGMMLFDTGVDHADAIGDTSKRTCPSRSNPGDYLDLSVVDFGSGASRPHPWNTNEEAPGIQNKQMQSFSNFASGAQRNHLWNTDEETSGAQSKQMQSYVSSQRVDVPRESMGISSSQQEISQKDKAEKDFEENSNNKTYPTPVTSWSSVMSRYFASSSTFTSWALSSSDCSTVNSNSSNSKSGLNSFEGEPFQQHQNGVFRGSNGVHDDALLLDDDDDDVFASEDFQTRPVWGKQRDMYQKEYRAGEKQLGINPDFSNSIQQNGGFSQPMSIARNGSSYAASASNGSTVQSVNNISSRSAHPLSVSKQNSTHSVSLEENSAYPATVLHDGSSYQASIRENSAYSATTANERSAHFASSTKENTTYPAPIIKHSPLYPRPKPDSSYPVPIINTGTHKKRRQAPAFAKTVRFAEEKNSWAWCDVDDDDGESSDDTGLSSLHGDDGLETLV